MCFQWAKIIIVLERTYSRNKLLQYQQRYSVVLDKKRETRAIMVINETKKSRACRSKGAIEHWKVKTILLLSWPVLARDIRKRIGGDLA